MSTNFTTAQWKKVLKEVQAKELKIMLQDHDVEGRSLLTNKGLMVTGLARHFASRSCSGCRIDELKLICEANGQGRPASKQACMDKLRQKFRKSSTSQAARPKPKPKPTEHNHTTEKGKAASSSQKPSSAAKARNPEPAWVQSFWAERVRGLQRLGDFDVFGKTIQDIKVFGPTRSEKPSNKIPDGNPNGTCVLMIGYYNTDRKPRLAMGLADWTLQATNKRTVKGLPGAERTPLTQHAATFLRLQKALYLSENSKVEFCVGGFVTAGENVVTHRSCCNYYLLETGRHATRHVQTALWTKLEPIFKKSIGKVIEKRVQFAAAAAADASSDDYPEQDERRVRKRRRKVASDGCRGKTLNLRAPCCGVVTRGSCDRCHAHTKKPPGRQCENGPRPGKNTCTVHASRDSRRKRPYMPSRYSVDEDTDDEDGWLEC